MAEHAERANKDLTHADQNRSSQKGKNAHTEQLTDNRPEAVAQRAMQELANRFVSARAHPPAVQKKTNNTGLSDGLKAGTETLSGYSLDDVKVHYNSSKPAQLQAHAYAQGTDIHVAPGQEKHLPHEAWHIVQQKQGRVQPTTHMGGTGVNDESILEHEADTMGEKASNATSGLLSNENIQRKPDWHTGAITAHPGIVIQRTPSAMRVNADWDVPSGWFSDPGKDIRERLKAYSALVTDADLETRATLLNILEGEIGLFRRDHPPATLTPGSLEEKVMIRLSSIERLITSERAEIAQSRDQQTGGHPQVRHGADISDVELVDRLIRQQDRADENAPSEISSRFDNDLQLNDTLDNATKELGIAQAATAAAFTPLIADHQVKWTAFAAAAKGTPAYKLAMKDVKASYNNLKAEKTNNNAAAGAGGTRIPIKLFNDLDHAAMAAAPATIAVSVNELVKSTVKGYAIKNPQKAAFGVAYELTAKAKAALTAAKATAALTGKPLDPLWHTALGERPEQKAAQPQATLTVRRPGVMASSALPPATNWQLITHFPIAAAAKEIS